MNSAPAGSRFLARRLPPKSRTMWAEIISPRPSPLPAGLVVTNGSNRRARIAGSMQGPVLRTTISHMLSRAVAADLDAPHVGTVQRVDRIAEQVAQHLLEPCLVADDGQAPGSTCTDTSMPQSAKPCCGQ